MRSTLKDTIEQQSDAFKATKFNLETEWKNSFPRIRELDRYELFEKAKNEILDKVLELPATVQPKEWENELLSRLWEQVSHHVVEHIFLPAAIKSDSSADFNTQVDIKLKQWADNMLPKMASEVAKQMLLERFSKVLVPYDTKLSSSEPLIGTSHHTAHFDPQSQNNERNKYDPIFDLLREQVLSESIKRHKWDEDYYKTLRVIQLNALEDRSVQDGNEWSGAINFIEKNLGKRLAQTDRKIEEMIGKGAIGSYYHWYTNSEEQKTNMAIKKMLTPLLTNRDKFAENPNLLSEEEVLTVRKSLELQRKDIKLPDSNQEAYKMIRAMWYQLYRRQFLVQKIEHCKGCRRQYYSYKNEVDNGILAAEVRKGSSLEPKKERSLHHGFNEIVLFWRIQKMLLQTSNAVRQQMINHEAKRLEKHVEQVLDDIGCDSEKLGNLLVGRRVALAEDLKKVRDIQNLLDEFITELRKEI